MTERNAQKLAVTNSSTRSDCQTSDKECSLGCFSDAGLLRFSANVFQRANIAKWSH